MSQYHGVNELREMFLSFFESKGHLRLPSFSLIPQNDASLLLINSGMAPMKPYFTGEIEPPRHRVCTCQKCIRTGDIENIGKTSRHGTYFEMLGNFSFGDYFKREAIHWSWEFLTQVVGLEPERLYPSIYQDDDEAFDIWNKEIGIAPERIFRFGKEDNFWEHGSGPCGPCSEIYYDRGEKYGCGKPDCTVGCDCDRYMEIWNNVFSQFNNDGHNHYTELKQKNIDTGMGLERLAVVCQDVDSLFDVDTVMNITNKVSEITGAKYGMSHKIDVSLRVITDHIRSATFMIGDGVLPSNEGRGYVLRRLLRRAARHGKLLGVNEPFLYRVLETVIHENQFAYPELVEKQDYITRVIRVEEDNFARTIDGGLRILGELVESHKTAGETVFSGADAFKLYDTYGFPIDLTIEMVAEHGMTVDEDAFQKLMQEQRERAREARKALGDLAWASIDLGLSKDVTCRFTGYDHLSETGCRVLALAVDGELRAAAYEGEEVTIVLDKTPLYAESGGQVADHGTIFTDGGLRIEITDVQKTKDGKIMHMGEILHGQVAVDELVSAEVDAERRKGVMRAHSATHLLQKALRTVLGDHVHQSGSLVEPDHLRFDFTHFSAITPAELAQISNLVLNMILDGLDVTTREMPIDEARKLGAMALFGEKYGDIVRVVTMGDVSVEFCGGTHVDNTAKIGLFRLQSESSIASGVRRIEAYTGKAVLNQLEQLQQTILEMAEALKTTPAELGRKAAAMTRELRESRQAVEKLQARELASQAENFLYAAKTVEGLHVVTATLQGIEADALRKVGDTLRDRDETVVALLSAIRDDKITLLAVCGKKAVAQGIKAGELIRSVAPMVGGSGGGKPDSAMGGGKDINRLDDALATVDDFVLAHSKH